MDQQELLRYSRHFLLAEIGMEGQEKLKRSRVLVIGAGGLGSPLALYLAAAGVGNLTIMDFDVVDESNLQRQILFSSAQVGQPKALCAAERLRALNPKINVIPLQEKLTPENALAHFQAHDVIADGADNFSTRYLSNDAAVLSGKPLVSASILGFEGQLAVFHYEGGPCYRCLYPEAPPVGLVPSCSENGVLGALPGILGAMQATEVIKVILGIGEPLNKQLLYVDALRMEFQRMEVHRDAGCRVCGENAEITALSADPLPSCELKIEELVADELQELLERNLGLQLVDVRDAGEVQLCRIEGSRHIPLAELSARILELNPKQPVVAYCKSGGRSAQAVKVLGENGLRAKSLKGGILSWIERIDPSLKKY